MTTLINNLISFELTSEDSELVDYIREHAGDSAKRRNEIERPRTLALSEHDRIVKAEQILNRG